MVICLALLNTLACAATRDGGLSARDASHRYAHDPSELAWLVGSWACTKEAEHIWEHWLPAAGNTLFGVNHTTVNGKLTFFEYLRIEWRPDGVFYIAQPKGSSPTEFKLTQTADQVVTFVNPEHDFPQRIVLTRTAAGYVARIEGILESGPAFEEWVFYKNPSAD
ncbi:MAG: hypothetical protein HUU55_10855 [Myxococcales bacterium]|nr:hypothetical protein [Myxococcales bacterium]